MMNNFKIEKKLLRIQNPIFIKNYWSDELKLIEVTIDSKIYTYNHLDHYFQFSFDQALDEIRNSLQSQTSSKYRPIRFFIESIKENQQKDLFDFIKNHELVHAKNAASKFNTNKHHAHDRFKIKSNYESIIKFLTELETGIKVNCIFDFNLNLSKDQFLDIHNKIIYHKSVNLVYYEDPLTESELFLIPKEFIKLIALDELLHRQSPFLNLVEWIVLKPAILEEHDLEYYLSLNKKINLSSCYEAPSQHSAYLKFIGKLNNDIHGIFKSLPK